MAINFGLLDTSTPEKLGEIPSNALARFAQTRQQLENQAMAREHSATQNALAKLQLTQGQRSMDEEDAFRNALAGVQNGDYAAAMPGLMRASPTRALALRKSLEEEQKAGIESTIKRFDLIDRTAAQFAANPTRQTGVWLLSQYAAAGVPPDVIQQMSSKLNAARDEDLPAMANAHLAATREGAKAQIERLLPSPSVNVAARQADETARHNRATEAHSAAALKAQQDEAGRKKGEVSAKAAEDLRKEFQGLQTYKNTQTIGESYKKIAGTSETGAGDVSLIYSYMRMVDPGSTVREGEFATAANAGGIPDRVVGWYNKILAGEKLPPEVRKQFRDESKNLLKAQLDRYEETAKPYRRLAEQQGLSPGDVVLDLGLQQFVTPSTTPATPQRAQGKDGKWYRLTPAGWEAE